MRLRCDSAANRKASSENRKVFSEESEGFFRRALGLYTHKFPKRGAASLTYLPHSRLGLPRSRLGLPRLRLSRNSGPAMEGFSNRGINFKDTYRICSLPWRTSCFILSNQICLLACCQLSRRKYLLHRHLVTPSDSGHTSPDVIVSPIIVLTDCILTLYRYASVSGMHSVWMFGELASCLCTLYP